MVDVSNQNLRDGASPFILKEVVYRTPRSNASILITSNVTDFQIFEHIDRPFLTGNISFTDTQGLISSIKFYGDEFIDITFSKPGSEFDIKKTFSLDRIINTTKPNQETEVFFFHMIQKTEYDANAKNVNKYYNGTPFDIINNILRDFTSLSLIDTKENDTSDPLKVIVPNLSPLEAAVWIKDRATTNQGMPFVLYQPLKNDKLIFADLGTLITQNVVNPDYPFVDWEASTQVDGIANDIQILDTDVSNTENLYDYIGMGTVGANYSYFDTTLGTFKDVKLDIEKVFQDLKNVGILNNNSLFYIFPVGTTVDDKKLSELNSRNIYSYPSVGSYKQGYSNAASYSEEVDPENYQRRVAGIAIKNLMLKSGMSVTVRGQELLNFEEDFTVGRLVRFLFSSTHHGEGSVEDVLDLRKSGDYLILAANHNFIKNPDTYSITFYCSKLQNVDSTIQRYA